MSTGAIVGIVFGVIGFLLLVLVIWGIATYNSLIKRRNDVDEAFSTMDIYLKKRFDLIPNLVETVKGYTKHENETLTQVMEARNGVFHAKGTEEKLEKENVLTSTLKRLYKVTEDYPALKADGHFSELMGTLREIEKEISASRKFYNANVKSYNNKREIFPSSIIANWFKFEKRTLYELDDVSERKNVKVQF